MKIVSGGQTGVDRAALDVALDYGLSVGGWCPRGRLAEDGVIDLRYPLEETPTAAYAERTAWNVRDSDATLIICRGEPTGGTALTVRNARQMGRPLLVVDPTDGFDCDAVRVWLRRFGVVNVAGPRASGALGIYADAVRVLEVLLAPA